MITSCATAHRNAVQYVVPGDILLATAPEEERAETKDPTSKQPYTRLRAVRYTPCQTIQRSN